MSGETSVWSNTDYPYMCLRDRIRTSAFEKAIARVVRKGDVVADIGTGTGILGLFALRYGASHVWAIDVDPYLCAMVEETARLNGVADRLTVVVGDACEVELPRVDVAIVELVETGLMDELQIPVINSLFRRRVADADTRIIPNSYTTALQLVEVDESAYGFHIRSYRHEWPFYSSDAATWTQTGIRPVSDLTEVWSENFVGDLDEDVSVDVVFRVSVPATANGVRVTGMVDLGAGVLLGACPSMNGDKVIPVEPRFVDGTVASRVSYRMGGGLASFRMDWPRSI